MRKAADLTGKVFGHLTVLYRQRNGYISPSGQKRPLWHCHCDCGKEVDVISTKLMQGKKTSCGHDNFRPDLAGKKFGEWTVIKDDGTRDKHNLTMWLCRCSCGNYSHVSTGSLRSGESKSCGHIKNAKLLKTVARIKQENPGTNPYLLNDKKPSTNTSGEKNISITYRNGVKKYRAAVMYKKKQYGSLCSSMEEAIELREELRRKYWPNYEK